MDTSLAPSDMLDIADQIFRSRDYVEARDLYIETAEKADQVGDSSVLTEAIAMIGRTYLITGKLEECRLLLDRAARTADPEDPWGWSRYLGVRGRFEWQDDRLEEATATFIEMYDFCSEHKLHERGIDAAHMVAITGDLETQVEWGLKGIKEAEAGNVTGWLGPLWNNLGATYEDLEQYDKALDAYKKARQYHYEYGDETNKLIADWAVGHAYRLKGDFRKARKWLEPLLQWSQKIDNHEFHGWTCRELGEIEFEKGNYFKAVEYLVRAKNSLKEAGMPDWDPDGYRELVDQIVEAKMKADG
jgi:tetratricopeptide (TPR) repeat protein